MNTNNSNLKYIKCINTCNNDTCEYVNKMHFRCTDKNNKATDELTIKGKQVGDGHDLYINRNNRRIISIYWFYKFCIKQVIMMQDGQCLLYYYLQSLLTK